MVVHDIFFCPSYMFINLSLCGYALLFSALNFSFAYFDLFEKQRDRDRYTKLKRDLSSPGSLSKCRKEAELGHPEARNLNINLDFPCEWQRSNYLKYYLLPPRMDINRTIESIAGRGLKPRF